MTDRDTAIAQFKRRVSKSQEKLSSHDPREPKSKTHWLDVWAPRLSHLSQFGLFLVTIGSLYFVVLPLYQKSVLEEAIARKEAELKQATVSLDKSYKLARGFAVDIYVLQAGMHCSDHGLLPLLPGEPSMKIRSQSARNDDLFSIDMAACLASQRSHLSYVLDDMRPDDKAAFESAVNDTATNLANARALALAEYRSVEASGRKNLASLPAPPNHSFNVGLELSTPEDMMARRLDLAIEHEKTRIASGYGSWIRSEIATKLANIQWPAALNK